MSQLIAKGEEAELTEKGMLTQRKTHAGSFSLSFKTSTTLPATEYGYASFKRLPKAEVLSDGGGEGAEEDAETLCEKGEGVSEEDAGSGTQIGRGRHTSVE